MATEENQAPSRAAPQNSTPAAAPTEPKLTAAQLKEKKKAEKQARRAAEKVAKSAAAPPEPASSAQAPGVDVKRGKSKGKHEGGAQQHGRPAQAPDRGPLPHPPLMTGAAGLSTAVTDVDPRSVIPEMFSHLPMAKRIPMTQAHKDVHPAVLIVGQQMGTFTLRDSISRLEATLLAFRKVIGSYETPKDNSLSRHFVPYVLNRQIDYLTECRPMSFAMGNAIRVLKSRVNKFDINTPEEEAKEALLEVIDSFIRERITIAEVFIASNAAKNIKDGDVILTYGRHRLVEMSILQARETGKHFDVCILDDPYDPSGQDLAKSLAREGMQVSYLPHLGGLRSIVPRATKALLGAEAFFANGAMYAPAGTSDVAAACADACTAVIALCQTINIDRERVATDPLTYNEIDPQRCSAESFRLLFDVTQSKYLSTVITESGDEIIASPAEALLSILSKQENPTVSE